MPTRIGYKGIVSRVLRRADCFAMSRSVFWGSGRPLAVAILAAVIVLGNGACQSNIGGGCSVFKKCCDYSGDQRSCHSNSVRRLAWIMENQATPSDAWPDVASPVPRLGPDTEWRASHQSIFPAIVEMLSFAPARL